MQEKGSIVFQNTVKSTPNLFSKSNFFKSKWMETEKKD